MPESVEESLGDHNFYAMPYTASMWEALVEEVEAQGGAATTDICTAELIEYEEPQRNIFPLDNQSMTMGCGHESILILLYDPGVEDQTGGKGFARVCGVCDGVGAMPRFEAAVSDADQRYWNNLGMRRQ